MRIARVNTGNCVDDEQEQIRLLYRLPHLAPDLDVHRMLWIVRYTAGVDEPELPAAPIGAREMTIARRARLLGDDRCLSTDDAVEESRFPDVRPSEQRNDGNAGVLHAVASPSRARAACVSLSLASTSMK